MKMRGSATSLVSWYLPLKQEKKTFENGICRFLSNVTLIDFFGLVFNRWINSSNLYTLLFLLLWRSLYYFCKYSTLNITTKKHNPTDLNTKAVFKAMTQLWPQATSKISVTRFNYLRVLHGLMLLIKMKQLKSYVGAPGWGWSQVSSFKSITV